MPVEETPAALAAERNGPSFLDFASWSPMSGGSFLATERRLTHVLDAEPSVTAYPEEASRRLWHEHTFRALPLTGS